MSTKTRKGKDKHLSIDYNNFYLRTGEAPRLHCRIDTMEEVMNKALGFNNTDQKFVSVRTISKPTQLNVMQVDGTGKNLSERMFAQTYIASGHNGEEAKAIHFVEINYGFGYNPHQSDWDNRWKVYKATGELFIPVKIEKHLLTSKVLHLSDASFDFESGSMVIKDGNTPYGFKITADLDKDGNFSALERQQCEATQAVLAQTGKRLVAEIDKPLYTDVKVINYNFRPTFIIWPSFKAYRKTGTWISIQQTSYNILPLPDRTYRYTPYEYSKLYTYGHLSMIAGLGGDLVSELTLKISEWMSGYHNHPDVYPPEVKEGDDPIPLQYPLPYKADPANAKIILLRRKYMIFVTNIKKAKVMASSILPTLNFNWEDDGIKWGGSCAKLDQRGTNLDSEEYIQRYILGELKANFVDKLPAAAKSRIAHCSLKDDAQQVELKLQMIKNQAKLDRLMSRYSKRKQPITQI